MRGDGERKGLYTFTYSLETMAQKAISANSWGLNGRIHILIKSKKIARTKKKRSKGETGGYYPSDDAALAEGERPVVPVEH